MLGKRALLIGLGALAACHPRQQAAVARVTISARSGGDLNRYLDSLVERARQNDFRVSQDVRRSSLGVRRVIELRRADLLIIGTNAIAPLPDEIVLTEENPHAPMEIDDTRMVFGVFDRSNGSPSLEQLTNVEALFQVPANDISGVEVVMVSNEQTTSPD